MKAKKHSVNATDAKNNFGELLDSAKVHPMKIEKNGRPVAVLVSAEKFEQLEAMEDAWWAAEAKKALKEGYLGQKESEALLAELVNAKD